MDRSRPVRTVRTVRTDITMRDRKLNRRNDWDYNKPGWYFVTVCSWKMNMCFGEIVEDNFLPNKYGRIVNDQWLWMIDHFDGLGKDEYVVMPNHVHGLINIVGTEQCSVRTKKNYGLLSKMIKSLKDVATKEIRRKYRKDFRWHRSFYDRIVRNQSELERIRKYIKDNPKKWNSDKNNPNL